MPKKFISIALLTFSGLVSAEQTVINDYDDARTNYLYDQIYVGTAVESFYRNTERPIQDNIGKQQSLEHVMRDRLWDNEAYRQRSPVT